MLLTISKIRFLIFVILCIKDKKEVEPQWKNTRNIWCTKETQTCKVHKALTMVKTKGSKSSLI